jgi:3D (Asp-Asp-Asp) domain-containing protein
MELKRRSPLKGDIGNILIIILLIATIVAYAIHTNTTKETEISNPIQTEESKVEEKIAVEEKDVQEEPKEEVKTETPQKKVETPKASAPTPTPTPQPKAAPAPAPKKSEPVQTEGNYASLGNFKISAYCHCSRCCGKSDGITATGTKVTANRTIAVDPRVIPLGSKVVIDGQVYVAEDTGGAIRGNRIDMYFATHQEALNWGVQYRDVSIINEV